MAKLYFRYGVMGSSKSAQALITKFNYEEQGMRVWLMKPAADTRYGADKVHSRIGLEQPADVIDDDMDLYEVFRDREREFYDVIIVDEAQFLQPAHVEQLQGDCGLLQCACVLLWTADRFSDKIVPRQCKAV